MSRGYWSNVFRVSGGVVAGQAISIAGYLFLTRIYGPNAFGTYATWLAFVAIGSVLSTGALETSLVREEDGKARRDAAAKIIAVTFAGSILFGFFCGALLVLAPNLLEGDRVWLAVSIAFAVFALATSAVLQNWAAAEGLFNPLIGIRIVQSSSIVLIPLALSLAGRAAAYLILGHLLGLLLATLAWLLVFKIGGVKWNDLVHQRAFLRERRRCFFYVLPGLLIGVLVANLPQLFVNWRFGSAAAGHLALALRVMGVPLSLIGVAVRDVFKRHAGAAYRERGECSKEFRSSFFVLAFCSLCFGVVMFAFGESLFVLVFGEQWRESGRMALWLLPMFVVGLVASPLTYLVYIVEREDFDLLWQWALFVAVAAVLATVSELELMLKLYSAVYAMLYGVYMFNCDRFAKGSARSFARAGEG